MQLSSLAGLEGFRGFGGKLDLFAPIRRGLANLVSCLPRWLRRILGFELIELVVDASTGLQWNATIRRAVDLPFQTLEGQGSGIQPDLRVVLAHARRLRAKVGLIIPATEILIRKVTFPTQTPDRLKRTLGYELLGYELDRLTPFKAQDLYYEFRILPHSGQAYIEVELAVVRRSVVDVWLQRFKEANGYIDVVKWPGCWVGANILPANLRRKPKRAGIIWGWLLAALVLSLAVAVIVSPLLQKRAIVVDMMAKVDRARVEAAKVGVLRAKIEQAEKTANFVVEQKLAANYVVAMLERLTTLVPDDAWANLLNYSGGQADFSGEAQQATALIEQLARDPTFRNSSFRSPVTSTHANGKERFNIQFNYVGHGGSN